MNLRRPSPFNSLALSPRRFGGAFALGFALGGATALHAQPQEPTQMFDDSPVKGLIQKQPKQISRAFEKNSTQGQLLTQIRTGLLSPEAAWTQGLLTKDDLLRGVSLWSDWTKEGKSLRIELVGVLAEHAPEVFSPQSPPPILRARQNGTGERQIANITPRRWMEWKRMAGQFYRDRKDERAVAWYEASLKDCQQLRGTFIPNRANQQAVTKAHNVGNGGLTKNETDAEWVLPLSQLATFYSETGNPLKAAQTWETAELYSENPTWLADVFVASARAYAEAGELKKATATYDRVPQYGHGWYTALSYYDQALSLVSAGKADEAKAILSRPLQARIQVADGEVAVNAWLASWAYQEGNLEEAARYSQIAIQVGEKAELTRASVKGLYSMARDVYNRSVGWKTQPIQGDVKELTIKTNSLQPTYARFRIKTFGDATVQATIDNLSLQARVLPINNWSRDALSSKEEENEVVVEVPADFAGNEKNQTYTLTLQSASRVAQATHVSVFIQAK